jgi:hypothetical protein
MQINMVQVVTALVPSLEINSNKPALSADRRPAVFEEEKV